MHMGGGERAVLAFKIWKDDLDFFSNYYKLKQVKKEKKQKSCLYTTL